MAIFLREIPTCPFCGAETMRAIYDEESKIIGDNFIRYESTDHVCEEMKNSNRFPFQSMKMGDSTAHFHNLKAFNPDKIEPPKEK